MILNVISVVWVPKFIFLSVIDLTLDWSHKNLQLDAMFTSHSYKVKLALS